MNQASPANRLHEIPLHPEDLSAIPNDQISENTRKAYHADLRYFMAWARASFGGEILLPLSIPVLSIFIKDHLSGLDEDLVRRILKAGVNARPGIQNSGTVCRRVAAISALHDAMGLKNPCRDRTIRVLLSDVRMKTRDSQVEPVRREAVSWDLLERTISTCDETLVGKRDKALLLFAFACGGFGCEEIASVMVEDLSRITGGYILPYSRTDQEGSGMYYMIAGKTAFALDAWLKAANITEGKLFRGITKDGKITKGICSKTVARIMKRRAAMAGHEFKPYRGRSDRKGAISIKDGFSSTSPSFYKHTRVRAHARVYAPKNSSKGKGTGGTHHENL